MIEASKASFSFEEFKVPKFTYNELNHKGSDLKIGFSPSGKYDSSKGIYELTLYFITHEGENSKDIIFELTSIAKFKFDSLVELSEIPNFFYKNAIAIMFPYLRAFISTLTLQANTKLLKLSLMNLSDLEVPLIENTVSI